MDSKPAVDKISKFVEFDQRDLKLKLSRSCREGPSVDYYTVNFDVFPHGLNEPQAILDDTEEFMREAHLILQ